MGSICCGCLLSGGQCTRAKCNDIFWILKSCNQPLMSSFKPYDFFLVSMSMYKKDVIFVWNNECHVQVDIYQKVGLIPVRFPT